jgi:REP element-mobilizing transposase RayT
MFCTKYRTPAIAAAWRERLHAYPGEAVRNVNGVPEAIGGFVDHMHLLIGLRANACLADVVRDVKAVSSRWVHEEIGERSFAWQYEHHRKRTFQEEYLELLKRSGEDYEERYLW